MKTSQIALFVGALVSGAVAMGCWVLTQGDAAITPQEGPVTVLIMCVTSVLFLSLLTSAAFLRSRTQGKGSIVTRALFLIGTCGTLVLLLFVATSKGKVFKLGPLPMTLLGIFILSALVFWPRKHRDDA